MNVTVLCILKDWKQLPLFDLSCHCCWCLRRWGVCYLQRHISHVWHSVIAVVIVIEIELWTACQVVLPEFSSWTLRCIFRTQDPGAVLRWWRNRTGRPLSPQNIHQRTFQPWVNSTKQLLNAGRAHQAPRKAAHCLQKEMFYQQCCIDGECLMLR